MARAEARQRDASSIPSERKRGRREREVVPEHDAPEVANVAIINPADAMAKVFAGRVDKIDKDLSMSTTLGKQPIMSTGVLAFDQAQGAGGIMPGLHIVFGGEGSSKSTMEMKIMGASLAHPIPTRGYYDAEGALDRKYTSQVIRTDDFESVFGARDQNGRWYKHAQVRYYDSNIVEEVFHSIHRQLKFMPDKIYHEKRGVWMLRFDRTKEQGQLLKDLVAAGAISPPSKTMFGATGQYFCETDNASPQAIFFIDSLPQLIPERIESEQNSDNASGWQAAALGKGMRYVRGLCRPKCAIIAAVNQLRSNPRPGPGQMDWYEPAGNAIKFNSDSRWMFSSRVPMDGFPRAENRGLGQEVSVEVPGGYDTYAFKGITCIKNKYGSQNRKTAVRVWTKDGNGLARGIDPVYDTYQFLDRIGMLEGFQPTTVTSTRKKFRILLPPIRDVEWTWQSFKALIIAQDYGNRRLLRTAVQEYGAPRFRLRDYCFNLIKTGKAEELLIQNERKSVAKAAAGLDLEAFE